MKKRNTPLFVAGLFAALLVLSFLIVAAGGGRPAGSGAVNSAGERQTAALSDSGDAASGESGKANADASSADSVTVVTSFYPMYIAAMNLLDGLAGVRLENLSEPQTGCLHDYQLVPADMELLTDADVFIINGGGMESFLGDVAERMPELTVIDTSSAFSWNMPMLEGEEHEADGGTDGHETDVDVHEHDVNGGADGHETEVEEHEHDADVHEHDAVESGHHHEHEINAHFWLSVPLYRRQVEAMADGLCAYLANLPEESGADMIAAIEKNRDAYLSQIDALIAEQELMKETLFDSPIIIFHEGFRYIAGDYGMAVVGDMDLDEERQISAGEVAGIVDTVRTCAADGKMPVILAEEQYGKEMAEAVAAETDVRVLYLDALVRADGGYEKDAYIKRMRANMGLLREHAKQTASGILFCMAEAG